MTEAQALELISQRFVTQWPIESLSVPFGLENEDLPSADTFAVMTTQLTRGGQATLGDHPRMEYGGWIYVKIWTPKNIGTSTRSRLCDAARKVFQRQVLGTPGPDPLTILAGMTTQIGTDGRWYMCAVQFPFSFYEQL